MSAADIALWIWLSPVLLCFAAMLCILAGMALVGVDRLWRRWRDLPAWGRSTVLRRWWRKNRIAVLAWTAGIAWAVGGFYVVVYLNGAAA